MNLKLRCLDKFLPGQFQTLCNCYMSMDMVMNMVLLVMLACIYMIELPIFWLRSNLSVGISSRYVQLFENENHYSGFSDLDIFSVFPFWLWVNWAFSVLMSFCVCVQVNINNSLILHNLTGPQHVSSPVFGNSTNTQHYNVACTCIKENWPEYLFITWCKHVPHPIFIFELCNSLLTVHLCIPFT